MRTTSRLLILVVCVIFIGQVHAIGAIPAQSGAAIGSGGPSVDQVKIFLKTLQEAVAIGNRHKVATLVDFPMQAWLDGRSVTIRNVAEFQSRYRQILDDSVRQSIAATTIEKVTASSGGVVIDRGRIVCRPVGSKGTLRIVAINEPVQGR